ncbi:hypothetical protein [Streptomyces sp. NPDC029041]
MAVTPRSSPHRAYSESEIKDRGPGHEEEAVADWLEQHPDMVRRMTPQ